MLFFIINTYKLKRTIFLLLLIITSTAFSQTEIYTGVYKIHHDINDEGTLDYKLTLKKDSTYTFHSYRKINAKNPEENLYGKGTWNIEKNNVLYFYTNTENDLDEKHSLDFTNTKARYITKNPRDQSDKEIKTHLRIYESNIPWLKGRKFLKN